MHSVSSFGKEHIDRLSNLASMANMLNKCNFQLVHYNSLGHAQSVECLHCRDVDDNLGQAIKELTAMVSISIHQYTIARYNTGCYLLPVKPSLLWHYPSFRYLSELVISSSGRNGVTVWNSGVTTFYADQKGRLLKFQNDDWLWIKPIIGRPRLSLLFW